MFFVENLFVICLSCIFFLFKVSFKVKLQAKLKSYKLKVVPCLGLRMFEVFVSEFFDILEVFLTSKRFDKVLRVFSRV